MRTFELFGYTMVSDGCTFVGSSKLLPACLIHDLDYSIGGSMAQKYEADERLYINLNKLGSVTRAYWMKLALDQPISMRWWGCPQDLIKVPAIQQFPWRQDQFDVRSNFWREL